mmetsp:Transcript_22072/g.67919  ORF Transcript_22072/g.67919 Transcript_22072/m.67919 type:complete len:200 (-) Transcript_22072:309-908(-)
MTSRCSGATASDTATASSTVAHATAKPPSTAGAATALVGSVASCVSSSAFTSSTTSLAFSPKHTRMGLATTSCSACARRSAATVTGSAVSSHSTSTSLGPASMSMPVHVDTSAFAAVTHLFPGPAITSQRGPNAPRAMAPIAWAPPIARTASAPDTYAAASVAGAGFGEHSTTCGTPAALAVTHVINTDDGKGYRPPGA